jgi:membrane-bound inhibitor of C-type lysozyme
MFMRLLMMMAAGAILAVGAFAFGEYRGTAADVVTVPLNDAATAADPQLVAGQAMGKPTPTKGDVVYGCQDGRAIGVSYGKAQGSAELSMNGSTSRLDPVFVADGAEWSDGVLTLFAKGEFAEVFFGGQSTSGTCVAQE